MLRLQRLAPHHQRPRQAQDPFGPQQRPQHRQVPRRHFQEVVGRVRLQQRILKRPYPTAAAHHHAPAADQRQEQGAHRGIERERQVNVRATPHAGFSPISRACFSHILLPRP